MTGHAVAAFPLLVELVDAGSMSFAGEPGVEWSSKRAVEAFVNAAGWSIGPTDRSHCRGVLFRTWTSVAKWHSLSSVERAGCDAVVVGDGRNGPLTLTITAGGRKRAAAKIAVGGPDINDVYRFGYVANDEVEADAQAQVQAAAFLHRSVVFEVVQAGIAADWDDRDWFSPRPGEVIVAHVDRVDVAGGFDGEVLYADWVLTPGDVDQLVIHQETGTQFRLGDLHDLLFQPPGVGTREGHHRDALLVEPSGNTAA